MCIKTLLAMEPKTMLVKLLMSVVGLLVTVLGWTAIGINNKLDNVATIQVSRGERIVTLETNIDFIKQTLSRIEKKLEN